MTAISVQPERHQLAAAIKERGRALGFNLVGIAPADASKHRVYLRAWLDAGKHGTMNYLAKRFAERVDPAAYFPGARSVICVAMNYHTPLDAAPQEPSSEPSAKPSPETSAETSSKPSSGSSPARGRIARYALGGDYHELIKQRLHDLSDWLRGQVPEAQTRCAVDTAPVLERELAARAGLGWIGKNTCVINEQIGSWILLGEIITTIDLPADAPAVDRCGTCRRCIDACPTGAITGPYQLDASRCISYLTIEQRGGEIPSEFHQPIGKWIFGCDICQEVCPFNSKALDLVDPELQPRFADGTIGVDEVLSWEQQDYQTKLRGSAMKRVKLPVLQRNARIVRDNARRKVKR